MMKSGSEDKAGRVLALYSKLRNGEVIYKDEESRFYDVTERTIQRDMEDIQNFLHNMEKTGAEVQQKIIYDRKSGGYILERRLKNRIESEQKIKANVRVRAVVDIVQIID